MTSLVKIYRFFLFKTSSEKLALMILLLIASWLFLAFLLIYTGSVLQEFHLKQEEINHLDLRIALLELEEESLNQKIKELQGPKYERGFTFMSFWSGSNDTIGPALKYLGMVVSVVVVLVVCTQIWPAPFLVLKKGIAAYISNFIETKNRTFTSISTDGSEFVWLVRLNKNDRLEILVKLFDGFDFMPVNNLLVILDVCLEEATEFPNHPYHQKLYELFTYISDIMSQAPLIPL